MGSSNLNRYRKEKQAAEASVGQREPRALRHPTSERSKSAAERTWNGAASKAPSGTIALRLED